MASCADVVRVLFLVIFALETSAGPCPSSQYQTKPLVLDCSAGSGVFGVDVFNSSWKELGDVPAGYADIRVELASVSAMHVVMLDASGSCIAGYACPASASCDNSSHFCHQHQSVEFSYVSAPYFGTGVQEVIAVSGVLPVSLSFAVSLVSWSKTVTSGTIRYSHGGTEACPKPLPGCRRCQDFQGCDEGSKPVCNGSATPSCSTDPALPANENWFEVRLGASGLPPPGSAGCQCCELTIGEPVRIGVALPLFSTGDLPAEREGHRVLMALRSLFQWFNGVRGGLCRPPLRHPAELVVLDAGDDALRAATQRLAYDHGIQLFLGPPRSLAPVAEMAARLEALVVAPSTATASTFDGCRFCYSLQPPAVTVLEPAFALLVQLQAQGASGSALRVATAQQVDKVSVESCGAVPLLAAEHGMRFVNWTFEAAAAAAAPELDVLILCAQEFRQCLSFVEQWKALPARSSPAAVILAGACVHEGLLTLPGYGGFLWAVAAKDFWADASSEAVDAKWSSSSDLTTADVADFLRLAPSTAAGADAYPTGDWLNNENLAQLQLTAERLAMESGRQGGALLSWAAASVLLSALEAAENLQVEAVAAALEQPQGMQTILGHVQFDANRQSVVGATVLQQVSGTPSGVPQVVAESTSEGSICTWLGCTANTSRLPWNSSLASGIERPVYPVPKPELQRQCYHSSFGSWGFISASFGYVCGVCPADEVSVYDVDEQRRFCQRCGNSEYVQQLSNGSRSCKTCQSLLSCAEGQYRSNCGCRACSEGSYSNHSNASVCEDCPEGQFAMAGASSCELCPPGKWSHAGTSYCVNCTLGTFADLPGSVCRPCPGGSHGPSEGLTACIICEAGSRSSWDGASCELCPPMTFQNLRNSSTCLPAQEGANFSGSGLAIAPNHQGFWTRQVGSQVSWEACMVPEACLANAECAQGSTGVQCGSCLPGYVRSRVPLQSSCDVCEPVPMILNTVLFLVLVVVLAMWLAKLSVERRSNPKDLRLGFLKFMLLYVIVEGALAQTAVEILKDLRESLGDLGPILARALAVFTFSPHMVAIRCLMDQLARHAGYLHGEGVAVSTTIAGSAAVAQENLTALDELAESLSKLNHTDWFSGQAAPLREALKDFQYSMEFYSLIFWIALPLVLWLLLYICNFLYVWICLIWDSSFNNRAIIFYKELVEDGTKETLASYDAEDWLAFIQAYFQKWGLFGIWSWDLAAARAEGFWMWSRAFAQQSRPLLISLVLVMYGSVLSGLMEFSRCSEIPSETVARSLYAPEVECLDFDTHLSRLGAALAALWLFGVPLALGILLHRARNRLSDDFEFPVEVSVLSFGYRLGCWNWESYLFLLKGSIIGGNYLLSPTNRSSFLFLVAVLHGFVSRAFNPFTARSDFALVKADGRFALFFVAHSILIQFLVVSTSIPRVLRIIGVVLVSSMVLLNILLVGYLLTACFACWQDAFIESYEFYDWELWRKNRRCLSRCMNMPVNMLLDHYKRRVRRRAYVSFDPALGWLTVCGSHGDQARATVNWRSGRPPDLSEAPSVPHAEVEESTAGQRRKVQKYLHQTAERLCLIKGCATFSVLELEFIIRAAFVFARRAELQKSKLARPLTLISREESFMGLDALQLLWSSLEEEGDAEDAKEEEQEEEFGTEMATTPSTPSQRRTRASFARATVHDQTRTTISSYEPLAPRIRRRYQTQLICNHFFDDPTRVLFFYSRVEFIRQAQVAKTRNLDVRNRMSTIPTERAAIFELVASGARRLRDTGRACIRALRERDLSSTKAKKKSKTLKTFSRRVAQTKILSTFERVAPIMEEMFNDETFARGVELQDFQLGLIVVEHTGDAELKELQDAFHERWFQHRQLVEHRIRTQQGLLREEGTQADADEDLGAAIQEAEATSQAYANEERPTVEDLRWMRLIMKAGGGIFKEKVMPSMGEINDLLRSRHGEGSSCSSDS